MKTREESLWRQKVILGVRRLLPFRELAPDAPELSIRPAQVSPAFEFGGRSYVWFSDGSLRHERAKARGKSIRRIWKARRRHARREASDQTAAYVRRQPA